MRAAKGITTTVIVAAVIAMTTTAATTAIATGREEVSLSIKGLKVSTTTVMTIESAIATARTASAETSETKLKHD